MSSALQRDLFAPTSLPAAVRDAVHAAIEAQRGAPSFTAETVRGALSYTTREILALPQHRNALPAILKSYAATHKIEHAGWTVAQRDGSRGRALRIWRFR